MNGSFVGWERHHFETEGFGLQRRITKIFLSFKIKYVSKVFFLESWGFPDRMSNRCLYGVSSCSASFGYFLIAAVPRHDHVLVVAFPINPSEAPHFLELRTLTFRGRVGGIQEIKSRNKLLWFRDPSVFHTFSWQQWKRNERQTASWRAWLILNNYRVLCTIVPQLQTSFASTRRLTMDQLALLPCRTFPVDIIRAFVAINAVVAILTSIGLLKRSTNLLFAVES